MPRASQLRAVTTVPLLLAIAVWLATGCHDWDELARDASPRVDAALAPLDVACGGAGQPCCSGVCEGMQVCASNVCVHCGSRNEACCVDDECSGFQGCTEGVCRCGAIGQACCASDTCDPGGKCEKKVCKAE